MTEHVFIELPLSGGFSEIIPTSGTDLLSQLTNGTLILTSNDASVVITGTASSGTLDFSATGGGGGGVSSINTETGAITIAGAGTVSVSNVGGVFTITGSGGGGTPASPNGTIQINASGVFGTVGGMVVDQTGNARGTNSLDIQSLRTAVTQVVSGNNSSAYGLENTVASDTSSAFGYNNTQGTSAYSSTLAGTQNSIGNNSNRSTAVGFQNSITNEESTAVGTSNNISSANTYCVGGTNTAGPSGGATAIVGFLNTSQAGYSAVVGYDNTVGSLVTQSAIIGSSNNTNGAVTNVIGYENTVDQYSNGSTIIGTANNAYTFYSSYCLGNNNVLNGTNTNNISFVAGSYLTIAPPSQPTMYFGLFNEFYTSTLPSTNISYSLAVGNCTTATPYDSGTGYNIGTYQGAFGYNLNALQPGELASGFVSDTLGLGAAGIARLGFEYNPMFNSAQPELVIGGTTRLQIPPGFTYGLTFNIVQVEADGMVNSWQNIVATCQNTGSVVMGVGAIYNFNGSNYSWATDGSGGTPLSPFPAMEDTGVTLLFDTSSGTNEIVIHVMSAPSGSLFYGSVDIVKLFLTQSGSSSSSS